MNSWYFFVVIIVLLALFWPCSFTYISVYLFFGCFILGKVWRRLGRKKTHVELLVSSQRVFFGEKAEVSLTIHNKSLLPLVWTEVMVKLPVAFQEGGSYHRLITVARRSRLCLSNIMECRTRGLFFLGPVKICSSDIFGFGSWEREHPELLRFVVYPRIVSLAALGFPAKQPLGSLSTGKRIYEDTTRFSSIREYVPGDPLKRIDWKVTARARKLQVRTYDPTITMSTAVFLNLNRKDYDFKFGADYIELAISVAASIINYIASLGQEVSLVTNGTDPLSEERSQSANIEPENPSGYAVHKVVRTERLEKSGLCIPFQKGQEHLVRILELLAMVGASENSDFLEMMSSLEAGYRLAWGVTVVFIVPSESDRLMTALIRFKRKGHNVVLIILHPKGVKDEIKAKCKSQGIVVYFIGKEEDLNVFRIKRKEVA